MRQRSNAKYGIKLTILLFLVLFVAFYFISNIFFTPQIDSFINRIKKDLSWKPQKLVFKQENSAQEVQKFFANWQFTIPEGLATLKSKSWADLECVHTDPDGQVFSQKDIVAQIKDFNLLRALKQLTNKEYPTRIPTDTRSKKNIFYNSLCKSNNVYYIIFTTTDFELSSNPLVKTVFAGGGEYWGPQHLAIVSGKDMKILEFIGKKRPVAYWNCGSILGLADNNILLGCGGGDGPGVANSLGMIDLSTQMNTELVYCQAGPGEGGIVVKCFNGEDKLYFERTESIQK